MNRYSHHKRPPQSAVVNPPSAREAAPRQQQVLPAEGFSPMLTALLSCTLKDGLCNHTAFHLLKDIYPYVAEKDRRQIDLLLGCRNLAGDILAHPYFPPLSVHSRKRPLTPTEKFLGLLRTLSRYGGQNAGQTFTILERFLSMQQRFSKAASGSQMSQILELMPLLNSLGGTSHTPGHAKGQQQKNAAVSPFPSGINPATLMSLMQGGGGAPSTQMLSMLANLMGGQPSS